mmetsp:Transcript_18476/g.41050  ORF Transcript_18476/g.41050 Transcript_18476/m.41050 type:complete len:82 (-) Transcript_18476:680-925(-)
MQPVTTGCASRNRQPTHRLGSTIDSSTAAQYLNRSLPPEKSSATAGYVSNPAAITTSRLTSLGADAATVGNVSNTAAITTG